MIIGQRLGTTELLYNCAVRMGLQPVWLAHDSLLAISTPLGERYLYNGKNTINSQLSSNLTRNKLATRLIIKQHRLPNIAFLNTANAKEAEQFLATHAKIIVKPITGSNSHDVRIVDSPEQLAGLDLAGYILEKYIAGKEMRYLVLNGKVIAVHQSEYGESVAETRDLERISYPESEWDSQLVDLALKTTDILGLRYGAVDYLIGAQGQVYILEVNSSPGMKWFHAPSSGPMVDVAQAFLNAMLQDYHRQASLAPDTVATYPVVAYS